MEKTYEIATEVIRKLSHDHITETRIERVNYADIGPYSEDDWLVVTGDEITTHFPDQDHINADYIEGWFYGFTDSLTKWTMTTESRERADKFYDCEIENHHVYDCQLCDYYHVVDDDAGAFHCPNTIGPSAIMFHPNQ